jgi:DNA-binding Lrp family transcriptional regulator
LSRAIILINAELGLEKNLLDQIKSIQNVKEAYLTYGVYDLIAIVEAETQDKLKQIITQKIRTLSGLKTTFTMIVVE